MKMKIGVALLGAVAVIGSVSLFARGSGNGIAANKPFNSITDTGSAPVFKTSYAGAPATTVQPVDFERAASLAVPSVVHIKTMTKFKQTAGRQAPGEDQDPMGEMFRHFFGDGGGGREFQQQSPDQHASGSGVIISQDGYIVTNNHVVDG